MDKVDKGISEELKRITHTAVRTKFPIMMGKVVEGSVDETAYTCTIAFSIDDADAEPMPGVMLNGLQANGNGLILFPRDSAVVWVAEIDGNGNYGIIKCSDIYKATVIIGNNQVYIDDNEIKLVQGNASVKIANEKFSILNGTVSMATIMQNILSHVMALTVPTPAGTSGIPINLPDFNSDLTDINNLLF